VFAAQVKHKVSYQGIVVSDPDRRDTDQLVDVRVSSFYFAQDKQSGATTKILAIAPLYPEVEVGEHVTLSGTLAVPQPFASQGGRTFNYEKYLEKDGVRFEIEHAYLDELAPPRWYSPSAFFASSKHLFLNGIDTALPEPDASLAAGLAIGGKSGLGTALEQSFILSGLVQLVVLSGYNVMIVAEGVMLLLGAFKLSRKYSAIAGAIAVVLFVLIAGLSSTALRAALMALIALYARATGRSYAASRSLLVVIFLLLLWNPLLLAYDPGFDLSVAATAGLIWLAPIIEVKFACIKSDFWRIGIATTLAAQVAVLPLLLYDTGNLSLVAIPANLLVMPIVPLAMAASAIAALAGTVLGPFAFIIGAPAYLATSYIIWIARTASSLPLAAFTIPAFSFYLVLSAYALLAYIALANRSSTTDQFTLSKKAST
jgi:competence protein ComEC